LSYSQIFTGYEADLKIKGTNLVRLNPARKSADYVQLVPSKQVSEQDHLTWLKQEVLHLKNNFELRFVKVETDLHGYRHLRYREYYSGLPVEYGVYYVHILDGWVKSVNGEFYTEVSATVSPAITKDAAFSSALSEIKAGSDKESNRGMQQMNDNGELIMYPVDNKCRLAYKFDIYRSEPLKRVYIYIDALTGKKLDEVNRICSGDAQGTAVTAYNGTRTFTTDSVGPANFRLQADKGFGGLRTWNASTGADFTDTDNYWNSAAIDRYAYDAHLGGEKTYDFYMLNFGHNSYDNAGAQINMIVHDGPYVNAFWTGTQVQFGDGDGVNYSPLTSMEIVGHEITHGVTEYSAGLVYSNESGALNESFSDVMGNTIRLIYDTAFATWYCGDQIVIPGSSGTPFRNLSNPNEFNNPDCYNGLYWNSPNEVHNNSGVQNFWYYLVSMGGSGVNDLGNSYIVDSIGLADASAIAYRNLTVYLTPNSNYADARFYSIQAAVDLFGNCSNQVIQVTNAWYAVGVGGLFSNAVVAGFTASQNYFCVMPATANFINQSLNATSFIWDFGDGDTSNAASPSHVYDTAGVYTVTLTAIGSASCGNSDTVVKVNYITVTNGGGPISPSCTPATVSNCCGVGITHVVFNAINKTSGNGSEGYQDFTCGPATTLTAGDPVPIAITTGSTTYEDVRAWIDYDNNGQFSNLSELVFSSDNKLANHAGIVNTSASAVLNTPLRMRILDDNTSQTITSACYNPQNGQAEDYTITFIANTLPPIADFVANVTTINAGGTVYFTDLTQHAPTSWQWSFAGGLPDSSIIQNPSVVYNTLGTYPVTLVVTNAFGTDSITKVAYINVVNSIDLCTGIISTNAPNGQLYDSGGPSGVYQNGESCTLLIDPGCALSVSLSFTQFSTESCCDHFWVYNGTSTAAPLILNASGTTLPPTVTANSGKMFISWVSNGSVTGAGWAAAWSSVIGSANPPIAGFSTDLNPPLATPVQFTDTTTEIPFSWIWDFGDGQFSVLQNPVHSYMAPGNYPVTLIAFNCISSDTVTQTIIVQNAPSISVNPDSISVALNCNDSITIPITIYNTGSGDLVFDINGSGSLSPVRVLAMTYGVDMSAAGEYQHTITGINQYFTNYTLDTTGTTSASVLQAALVDMDVLLLPEHELSVTVPYASLATVVQNFANGGGEVVICGSVGGASQTRLYDLGLFTGNYVNYTNAGTVIVNDTTDDLMDGVGLTLQATNSTFYHNITNPDKIELAAYLSNDVVTYRNIGSGKAVYIGFDYYDVNTSTQRIISNSVRYANSSLPPWIEVSSITDTIAPGDSVVIYITISSVGLNAGIYDDIITINSNDTLNSPLNVPVHLTVSGPALIALSDTCINFGIITQYTFAHDTLTISNSGCDTLHVSSITSSDPAFTANPVSLDIAPYENGQVVITFNPQTAGTFSALLTILNNDIDTVICLSGSSLSAPAISFNPAALNVNVNACNDSITVPLWVINSGGSDLTFNIIGGGSLSPVRVLAMIYGVDMTGSGEYDQTISGINQYFTNYTLDTTGTISASVLQAALVDKDVLLLPEHELSVTVPYASLAAVVQSFVNAGGEVVVCGSLGGNSQTRIYDLGLFTGNYAGYVNTGTLSVNDTTDDLMDGVGLTLAATNSTFYHNITNPDKIELAEFLSNDVVTYRNIGAGKAVFIGFDYYDVNASTQRIISNTIRYANSGSLPPWIVISSGADTVIAGDSVLIYVTLYSGTLPGGTYTANLVFVSNDPLHPTDTVPVTLNVGFNPCANFTFSQSSPCSGVVNFQDTTVNAPTSWLWYFGDGDSSLIQNPSHTYSAAGNYTVTLIACNASGCDTISYPVTITSVLGPVAASCIPITAGYCCNIGIMRVQFNTIDNLSLNASEGYKDFTCTDTTTVTAGLSYLLTVTTGSTYSENTQVWIDYNNDGIFNSSELVLSSLNVLLVHSATVVIPTGAVYNIPLRMRVGSDRSTNPTPAPCVNSVNGQFEDYTVIIRSNTIPPDALFAINIIDVCTGDVDFTDLSTNFPTSWYWTFGDGQNSAAQNPSHQYQAAGTYTVTLIAANPYGSDTIVQYVTVNVISASFTVSGTMAAGQPLQFNPVSTGATSWQWAFGDGSFSSVQSPVYTYSAPGTYIVALTVFNGVCTTTVYDTLVIGTVGIEEIEDLSSLLLLPNPFHDQIQISFSTSALENVSLKVVDIPGRTVQSFLDNEQLEPGMHRFTFNNDAPGAYFVIFRVDEHLSVRKIIKTE